MSSPERKRQRTDDYSLTNPPSVRAEVRSRRSAFLASLNRGVSPPPGRESALPPTSELEIPLQVKSDVTTAALPSVSSLSEQLSKKTAAPSKYHIIPSPFKLTHICDLPASANLDTIGIRDILGHVLLKEVWLFDFLYDVDWVMQQFDPDILPMVKLVMVHGSWRREDSNKTHIDEASKRYPNVRVVTAYMPEPFGCHHSKCMVLFRHDDLAQVIVHTANMIEQDWRNMTQGVWLSPLLPRQAHHALKETLGDLSELGTGSRFKRDFMAYLRYYGNRTTDLVSQLEQYDFIAIRAALIAHVPAKFDGKETDPSAQLWGWPALKRALQSIPPSSPAEPTPKAQQTTTTHTICQVSSIGSLSEKWIRDTLFSTLQTTSITPSTKPPKPPTSLQHSIIFPTPSEIRTSLDGYAAGGSIHCKLVSAAQRKQFEVMKPHLCHWNPAAAATSTGAPTSDGRRFSTIIAGGGKALRGPAAPHIKTFIRLREIDTGTGAGAGINREIDWALLTSANLSTQAWGTAAQSGSGEVRVSSYELGVLVWPALFLEEATRKKAGWAKMIPTFGTDTLTAGPAESADAARVSPDPGDDSEGAGGGEEDGELVIVGLRMPYDLPLTPYGRTDEVWSAKSSYEEPDVFGRAWKV